MSLNVLTANVRDETSVAITFAIQNQNSFLRGMFAETFCAKKNSQFQRHVEPGN